VPEVNGEVVDIFTNKPVAAATVFMQDSATPPHDWEVGTDKNGKFKIVATEEKPITPGTLAFKVEKTGWAPYERTIQAAPGVPATARLTISALASSAAPTTAAPSGSATGPGTTDTGTDIGLLRSSDGGGLSWVLIAMGGLLVVLGLGAISLLLFRRGDDAKSRRRRGKGRGGPRGGPGSPRRRPGGPPGRGPGGPNMRTPVSPGPRPGESTMIARSPLADVPTQPYRAPYGGGPPGYGPPGGMHPDPYATSAGGYGPPHDPYAPPHDARAPRSAPPDGRRLDWLDD
jgi:hypothetical protein